MTTAHAIAAALLRSVAFAATELSATLAPAPRVEASVARADLDDVRRRLEAVEGHVVNGTLARAALAEVLLGTLTPAVLAAEENGTDVAAWLVSPSVVVVRRALKVLGGSEGSAAPDKTAPPRA